jgi:hypothetical protein
MPGGLKVTSLVVFSILALVSVVGSLTVVGTTLSNRYDQAGKRNPVFMGEGSSPAVAVVYHPGGSGLMEKIVMSLGRELETRGYSISVFTANPALSLDRGKYGAIVLASPVYGGEIRPPLRAFISAGPPISIPTYGILSGWFGNYEKEDLAKLSGIIAGAGGNLRSGIKIPSGSSESPIQARVESLCNEIDAALKGALPEKK